MCFEASYFDNDVQYENVIIHGSVHDFIIGDK